MFFNHSTNGSFPSQLDSFIESMYLDLCSNSFTAGKIYIAFNSISIILILPPSAFVLYLGYQQWKRQRVSTSAMSHSDFYTYNMAIMELFGVLGSVISISYNIANLPEIILVGILFSVFPWSGQMLLPMLICLERYQAVVHPITYMRLRKAGGLYIRNISTALIWLMCFMGLGFTFLFMKYHKFNILGACVMVFCLTVTTFCSLSILYVLIRPRPGEAGGGNVQTDLAKRRAFKIIIIIMGVLFLKFAGNLVCFVVNSSTETGKSGRCFATAAAVWFNLPSSLVLPLLFLFRTKK